MDARWGTGARAGGVDGPFARTSSCSPRSDHRGRRAAVAPTYRRAAVDGGIGRGLAVERLYASRILS